MTTRRGALLVLALVLAAGLARAGDDAAKRLKQDLAAAGADAEKQVAAVERAAASDSGDVAEALFKLALVDDASWKLRDAVVAALRGAKGEASRSFVTTQVSKGADARARALAAAIVGGYGGDAALKALVPALRDKEWQVQAAAIDGLALVRKKESIDALVALAKDAPSPRLQTDLSAALRALTGEKEPRSGVEWASWWAGAREAFAFDAPKGDAASQGPPKTQVRSTPDGSGLYQTISSNRVVFVVDVSGSMQIRSDTADGKNLSRLEYVQQELAAAIEAQLPRRTWFNVISFSDVATAWRKKLVEATTDNKKAAKEFVKKLEPKGETNAYDALELALSDKTVDTVYFLTDGFPTCCSCKDQRHANPVEILGEIRKLNVTRRVRLNCIAFVTGDGRKLNVVEDKRMAKDFMKDLAGQSSGDFRVFE